MDNFEYIIVTTTTDSLEVVHAIRDGLLGKKLCVCVQISEVDSTYLWRGEIENSREYKLAIKSKRGYLSI